METAKTKPMETILKTITLKLQNSYTYKILKSINNIILYV